MSGMSNNFPLIKGSCLDQAMTRDLGTSPPPASILMFVKIYETPTCMPRLKTNAVHFFRKGCIFYLCMMKIHLLPSTYFPHRLPIVTFFVSGISDGPINCPKIAEHWLLQLYLGKQLSAEVSERTPAGRI